MQSDTPYWPDTIPTPLEDRTHKFDSRMDTALMETGRRRNRRTEPDATELIEVRWNFTEDTFNAFKDFYEGTLENGSLMFYLVSYEPSENEGKMMEVTRLVAFADEQYSFDHSDNVFAVSDHLEVVETNTVELEDPLYVNPVADDPKTKITVAYPTVCRDTFQLAWNVKINTYYRVQLAQNDIDKDLGIWCSHIVCTASAEDVAAGKKTITLNNDYAGLCWFRVIERDTSKVVGRPTKPQASVIQSPSFDISNTVDPIFSTFIRQIWQDGGYPMAINRDSSPNVTDSETYIVPRRRFEWGNDPTLAVGLNWDGAYQIVSLDNEYDTSGLIVKWTRDGSDPTIFSLDNSWDGQENNLAAYRDDFAMVFKARSFNPATGCKSPLTLYYVDKRMHFREFVDMPGRSGDITASCDYTRHDTQGHEFETTQSCVILYGDADAFSAHVLEDMVTLGDAFNSHGGALMWRNIEDNYDINVNGYASRVTSAGKYEAFPNTNIARSSRFDSFPYCYNYIDTWGNYTLTDVYNHGDTTRYYGKAKDNTGSPWVTGHGGVWNSIDEAFADAFNQWVPFWPVDVPFEIWLGRFDIILTAQDDFYSPQDPIHVPLPAGASTPLYLPPDDVGYDTFEFYTQFDVFDLFIAVPGSEEYYNGPFGWGAAWHFDQLPINDGEDDFESYNDGAPPSGVAGISRISGLVDGSGWFGKVFGGWAFPDQNTIYGGDDWESYSDGPVIFYAFSGGTGWDGTDAWWYIYDNPGWGTDLFQDYTDHVIAVEGYQDDMGGGGGWLANWSINSSKSTGAEDWESYADGTIPEGLTDLAGGSNWTGNWYIYEILDRGYDTFETYVDGTYISGNLNQGHAWNDAWALN